MRISESYQGDMEVQFCSYGDIQTVTLVLSETALGIDRVWECDVIDQNHMYCYRLFYDGLTWVFQRTVLPDFGDVTLTSKCVPSTGEWLSDLSGFTVVAIHPKRRRMDMAELIDNVEVKLGRAIRVRNLDPRKGEAENYIALQVEDLDGENERCILFTEHELDLCPVLDITWDLVPGRLYPYADNQYTGYIVKTFTYSKTRDEWYIVVRRISTHRLEVADERAMKNPEDLTHKSWLVDWLD